MECDSGIERSGRVIPASSLPSASTSGALEPYACVGVGGGLGVRSRFGSTPKSRRRGTGMCAGNLTGMPSNARASEAAVAGLEAQGLPTWAALSALYFIGLALPALPLAAEVVIAADHDDAGLIAAEKAAALWTSQGRKVSIALPPIPGTDFNDMARDELSAKKEFAA